MENEAKIEGKIQGKGKNNRAKIEGKTQGKGKGKTTNYYFPHLHHHLHHKPHLVLFTCVILIVLDSNTVGVKSAKLYKISRLLHRSSFNWDGVNNWRSLNDDHLGCFTASPQLWARYSSHDWRHYLVLQVNMINIKIMIIIPSGQLGLSCYQLSDSLSTWSLFFFFLFSSSFFGLSTPRCQTPLTHTLALWLLCFLLPPFWFEFDQIENHPGQLARNSGAFLPTGWSSSIINTICIFLLITIIVTIVINVIMLNFVTIAMEISFRLDTVGMVTDAVKRCQV